MLTAETKRHINSARDILVGQLPLPTDQVELITITLIYKFMSDIDGQSRELGGKATFFTGELRDLSWPHIISNTLSADARVTLFTRGIEAISHPKQTQIPDLFKSIFRHAFLKFRDGRILKLFLDEINGFTYDLTRIHPRDPLHGLTLEQVVNELVQRHGWRELGRRIPVRCFQFNPSVKSSLTFLRKTPWARQRVEDWFIAEKSDPGEL